MPSKLGSKVSRQNPPWQGEARPAQPLLGQQGGSSRLACPQGSGKVARPPSSTGPGQDLPPELCRHRSPGMARRRKKNQVTDLYFSTLWGIWPGIACPKDAQVTVSPYLLVHHAPPAQRSMLAGLCSNLPLVPNGSRSDTAAAAQATASAQIPNGFCSSGSRSQLHPVWMEAAQVDPAHPTGKVNQCHSEILGSKATHDKT